MLLDSQAALPYCSTEQHKLINNQKLYSKVLIFIESFGLEKTSEIKDSHWDKGFSVSALDCFVH